MKINRTECRRVHSARTIKRTYNIFLSLLTLHMFSRILLIRNVCLFDVQTSWIWTSYLNWLLMQYKQSHICFLKLICADEVKAILREVAKNEVWALDFCGNLLHTHIRFPFQCQIEEVAVQLWFRLQLQSHILYLHAENEENKTRMVLTAQQRKKVTIEQYGSCCVRRRRSCNNRVRILLFYSR